VDITSVTIETIDGDDYAAVETEQIPSYNITIDSANVTWLNSRPNADTDFDNGATTVEAGDQVVFGQDIGYSDDMCSLGYWPPGPVCPESNSETFYVRTNVETTSDHCEVVLGTVGYFVNGVPIFGPWDGVSYDDNDVWKQIAVNFEYYDVDICFGHAAQTIYHHHYYSWCLAEQLNDLGDDHSPVIGFLADGMPLYGFYQSAGVKAQSCWKARDYSDSSDDYGCGGSGQRTCVMVDPYDKSQGTEDTSSTGPDDDEEVTSSSGNVFTVSSGYYMADWYFDSDCCNSGDEYLDKWNGHEHGDYGYHIHATETYPFMVGQYMYGSVPDNSILRCTTTSTVSGDNCGSSSSGGLSNLDKALIGVGVALGVLLAGGCCYYMRRRSHKNNAG